MRKPARSSSSLSRSQTTMSDALIPACCSSGRWRAPAERWSDSAASQRIHLYADAFAGVKHQSRCRLRAVALKEGLQGAIEQRPHACGVNVITVCCAKLRIVRNHDAGVCRLRGALGQTAGDCADACTEGRSACQAGGEELAAVVDAHGCHGWAPAARLRLSAGSSRTTQGLHPSAEDLQ